MIFRKEKNEHIELLSFVNCADSRHAHHCTVRAHTEETRTHFSYSNENALINHFVMCGIVIEKLFLNFNFDVKREAASVSSRTIARSIYTSFTELCRSKIRFYSLTANTQCIWHAFSSSIQIASAISTQHTHTHKYKSVRERALAHLDDRLINAINSTSISVFV